MILKQYAGHARPCNGGHARFLYQSMTTLRRMINGKREI